ncbi:MAG: hypothetical protein RLZZ399_1302 [Verrucomicrobiota bacterium]|jgi:lysophospholipase L1-like esterase
MKNILCFGDSNTWGYDPVASTGAPFPARHAAPIRWTGVLQSRLGPGYRVLEEGLNGRTTVFEDPLEEGRNGKTYLLPCLGSHQPLDWVVLMLGTNDLKGRFHLPPADIAEGAARLVQIIQSSSAGPGNKAPRVLLVCPPTVTDLQHLPGIRAKFEGATEKSRQLPAFYEAWAERLGCHYLNSQNVVQTSLLDGLHLEASEHAKLAEAIATCLQLA